MAYVDGFVAPVPADNKAAYIAYAEACWPLFARAGALRMMETWGDAVPDGVHTSFPMAVKLEPGEVVVFSWIEWPDKATRDACHAAMPQQVEWENLGPMPLDGKRMVYGGFSPIVSRP